jgi:hypothetical protein
VARTVMIAIAIKPSLFFIYPFLLILSCYFYRVPFVRLR